MTGIFQPQRCVLWLREQNEVYHNCSFLSSATKSSSVVPVSFSAFSTLFIASSIDAGPKRGSETLVCVFPFNVVDAIILLLYVTDVAYANYILCRRLAYSKHTFLFVSVNLNKPSIVVSVKARQISKWIG